MGDETKRKFKIGDTVYEIGYVWLPAKMCPECRRILEKRLEYFKIHKTITKYGPRPDIYVDERGWFLYEDLLWREDDPNADPVELDFSRYVFPPGSEKAENWPIYRGSDGRIP